MGIVKATEKFVSDFNGAKGEGEAEFAKAVSAVFNFFSICKGNCDWRRDYGYTLFQILMTNIPLMCGYAI